MSNIPNSMIRLKKVVVGAEEVVSVTFLVAVTVLLVTQFMTRYLLSTPLVWTEEASRYAFVWMIFVGSAMLAAKNAHIVVTFISEVVKPSAGRGMVRVAATLVVIAAAITSWAGVSFVEQMSVLHSPATGISMGWVYLAPVVGFALIALHSIEYIITGNGTPESGHVEAIV